MPMTALSRAAAQFRHGHWRLQPPGGDTWFVLVHFLTSRAIFLAGGVLTAMLLEAGAGSELLPLALSDEILAKLRQLVEHGDSHWYRRIVDSGYEAIPFSDREQHDWAFFPLYPLVVRALGGSLIAGVIASNVMAFLAVRILVHEVRVTESAVAARWTALFVLYWPFSGMLSGFRPEALLLLLAVLTWSFARRGHWWLAWIAVALATLTRSQGVLVALLLVEPLWAQRERVLRSPSPALLGATLPLVGIAAFSLHLGDLTGDPLAWAHIQSAWGRSGFAPMELFEKYWPPLFVTSGGWDFAALNTIVVGLVVLASLSMLRARRVGFALFSLAWVAVPTLLGPSLMAIGRFATALFPVFMTLATSRGLRRFRQTILAVMAGLLFGVGAWTGLGIKAVMA
jgi:hypothetical protein